MDEILILISLRYERTMYRCIYNLEQHFIININSINFIENEK